MNNKQISFTVNRSDVRPLIANVLSLIIVRENVSRTEAIAVLDEACKTGNTQDILAAMTGLFDIGAQTAQELQNISSLVNDLSEKEELTSPDTEVLENLPNLKKNSLGVDRGSIEPITITPNHPKE